MGSKDGAMCALRITNVQVCSLEVPPPAEEGPEPTAPLWGNMKQGHPMDRFSEPPRYGSPGGLIWVKVTAENGMWGLGYTDSGSVTSVLIKESLMSLIIGQEVGAIDRCNDLMWHGTLSFGNEGLTARAVAAIDLALWDLWGKVLDQPVYRLA